MTSLDPAQLPPDHPEDSTPEELQQKLQAMQARIAFLESQLSQLRPPRIDIRSRLRALATLLVAVSLATIPALLVVADRWLGILSRDVMHDDWCQSSYLCQTTWPSYFLVAFACIAGLLVFLFFQRHRPVIVVEHTIASLTHLPVSQGQIKISLYLIVGAVCGFAVIVLFSIINQDYPGWSLVLVWLTFMTGCFLRAFPRQSIVEFWKIHGELWIAILLTFLAIIAILVGLFGQPQIFGATVVLLILALANLWRFRRRIPPIFWIVALALIVYTININSWWTAVIGDEFDFHDVAQRLAENTNFLEWDRVLFKANGVFGTHPYFSSVLQAISMKFLGTDNFGWRFSNVLLCALSVGLLYFFCSTFISKRASLIAAFLLAVSSYVMSFGKIGYNNLQALFALTLVLALAAWTLRSKLPLAFACLGSAVALCFYVFPAALYVIPLPLLLLAFYYPPVTRGAAKRWLIMLAVAAALIFPLLLQPIYWQTKIAGTLFNRTDLSQSFDATLRHFTTNIPYALLSFLYVPEESHFVASSYLDPLTAALFLIGFCLLLYQLRRQRFALFVLLSFVYFVFSVGASHDRESPPNTRMFLFLPLFALIASWGMIWVEEKAKQVFPNRAGKSFVLVPILLVVIMGINLFQAYPLAESRYTGLQLTESLFVRISQHVYEAEPTTPKNYAVVVNEAWGIDGLLKLQKIYPHLAWAQIHQIRISEPAIPESDLPLLADRNTLVLLTPWLDSAWVAALEAPLRALGKEPCKIATSIGEPRFVLYHAPDLPQACDP
jgi:hypothetical protein